MKVSGPLFFSQSSGLMRVNASEFIPSVNWDATKRLGEGDEISTHDEGVDNEVPFDHF